MQSSTTDQISVRPARITDAERISLLSQQLGYPASEEEIKRRFDTIQHDADHALFVAETGGWAIGWVHVFTCPMVTTESEAEVGGLVVEEKFRRSGVGRLLMERAEEWARGKGCRAVYLRSNIIRKDTKPFYEKIGYTVIKTQLAFQKIL